MKLTWVQSLCSAFLLRRLKSDVLKDLPKKECIVYSCDLSTTQRRVYDQELFAYRGGKATPSASGSTPGESSQDSGTLSKTASKPGRPKRSGYDKLFGGSPVKDPLSRQSTLNNDSAGSGFKNVYSRLRRLCASPLMTQQKFSAREYSLLAQLLLTRRDDFLKMGLTRLEKEVKSWSDFQVHQQAALFGLSEPFLASPLEICSGAKVEALLKILAQRNEKGDKKEKKKTLVFSQFTQYLDVLELALKFKGHHYVRLDGSTQTDDRQVIVDSFCCSGTGTVEEEPNVFLLSTKAGGVGLNLVAADMVILMDLSYNPQDNRQSEDRIHRLGQTKEVKIVYHNYVEIT